MTSEPYAVRSSCSCRARISWSGRSSLRHVLLCYSLRLFPIEIMLTTAESYAAIVAQRVTTERFRLAEQWLGRLRELLTVELNDVFPSDQLLDHIPLLIANVAAYLRAPADEEIAANAAVIEKARELGVLRHQQ